MDFSSGSQSNSIPHPKQNFFPVETTRDDSVNEICEITTNNKVLPSEQAFSNPLILKKILGYLDNTGDLLNCRAVYSDWKFLATEILLQRKCVNIALCYEAKKKVYFKQKRERFGSANNKYPLENLFRLIKSADLNPASSKFPCVSFSIVAGQLETKDMSSFFHLYGERIENLRLNFKNYIGYCEEGCDDSDCDGVCSPSYTKSETVRQILCRLLPNLRELEVENHGLSRETSIWDYFEFWHLFQEFQSKSKSTTVETAGTSPSPGQPVQADQEKILMIARLPKLQKLHLKIITFHMFHGNDFDVDPGKRILMENMLSSKSLEFYPIIGTQSWCKVCVGALVSTNQVGKIETLNTKQLGLELMERIVQECPKQLNFDELQIDFDAETLENLKNNSLVKNRMIRVLHAIFESIARRSSSKSKTDIFVTLKQPLGLVYGPFLDLGVEIPVMESVLGLKLRNEAQDVDGNLVDQDQDTPFFPRGFNLSHSFPNLQQVELNNIKISADLWGEDFQNCQSLLTVKRFYLNTQYCGSTDVGGQEFSVSGFSKLPLLFPNLVKIRIDGFKNFPQVAPFLWSFKELEKLDIGLNVSSSAPGNLNSNEMGAIDAAFTGFTMETCQGLRKSQEFLQWAREALEIWTRVKAAKKAEAERKNNAKRRKIKQEEEAEDERRKSEQIPLELPEWLRSLRVNPSICDLPKLKKFELHFSNNNCPQRETYSLISELSGLCAFCLMPQLKVQVNHNIDYDILDALRKMAPFMRIPL